MAVKKATYFPGAGRMSAGETVEKHGDSWAILPAHVLATVENSPCIEKGMESAVGLLLPLCSPPTKERPVLRSGISGMRASIDGIASDD